LNSADNNTGKRHRLIKNSLYGFFSWLFPIIPALVVTPIVIAHLGNEQYGLYMIVLGFVSYFFTINIGRTAAKYVAEYKATGEVDKISDVVSATLLLGIVVGIITIAIIAIFAQVFVSDILLVEPAMQRTAVVALYLGCANILVSMLGLTFQFILQGLQRFDRYLLITNLASLLLSAGTLAVVFMGGGVVGLFITGLLVSTVTGLISLVLVRRLLPELEFRLRVGREAWTEVWRYALSIMGYQLFGSVLLLFERAWLSRRFGTEAVAFYAVPMALALYLQMFVGSLILAVFPVVNEHLSQKEVLIRLYKKTTRIVWMIVGLALVSAATAGQLFLDLWLGNDYAVASYGLLVIHTAAVSLVALTMVAWQIAESYRSAPLVALANFALMAIAIPAMVFFSSYIGPYGVAYGRLAGILVYVPLVFYIEQKFLGGVFWSFWIGILLRVVLAAVGAGTAIYLAVSLMPRSWFSIITAIGVGGIVYLSTLLVAGYFEPDERLMIRNVLLRRFGYGA
jgi:O-antigen/teichoic acid export membrane protein